MACSCDATRIATLVRKTGTAILAFIAYTLLVEPLLRTLILPHALGRILPSHVFGLLVANPFFGYVGMQTVAGADASTLALSTFYVVALVLTSGWLIARQDL